MSEDEHGRKNSVDVEVGGYGRDFGGEHVIQIIISEGHLYHRRELEWAALTLGEAEDLYEELGEAIEETKKKTVAVA